MKYRAALFDLDGTLLDTLEDLADSMNQTLAALQLPQHPVEAYRTYVGDGIEQLVLRAAPTTAQNDALRRLILEGMREEYGRRWANKSRPYPGIPELLDALRTRDIPMAVLSNKPHNFTELCVAELLPQWRFDVVFGLREDVPRKPDPAGALRVAEQMAVAPHDFVYLGDTDTDMQTANRAGMDAVGALWGFRSADELKAHGAKTLIEHPMQLLEL